MARALRIQFPGAYYHVTCRGNGRQLIFLGDEDRKTFIEMLQDALAIYDVRLCSYSLMPNHFHLVLKTMRANLAEFMRRFNIHYTGRFNYRHARCGHLYQGRYKALLIDASNYLVEVSRYVHLNCVRVRSHCGESTTELFSVAAGYPWSSLSGYVDLRRAVRFIDYDQVLDMAGGRNSYRRFIIDGIERDLPNPFRAVQHGVLLGDDDFVRCITEEHVEAGSAREQSSFRGLTQKLVPASRIITVVAQTFKVSPAQVTHYYGDSVVRGVAAELMYRYSRLYQPQIGRELGGIDYSAVNKLRSRLRAKMIRIPRLGRLYGLAEGQMKQLSIVEI